MERVHFSIERVTSGKWFNFSETLFPSSEIRANSPPRGSKKISRYKRALVQTEESIIGVSYDKYLLNKCRQRKRILVTLWIWCEQRLHRFIRDEMKAQGRDWPKSIASGRQSCYHSVFLAGSYLCSLITALPPPPLTLVPYHCPELQAFLSLSSHQSTSVLCPSPSEAYSLPSTMTACSPNKWDPANVLMADSVLFYHSQ